MEVWIRKYVGEEVAFRYKVSYFDSVNFNYSSPISPMPLPEEGGEENVLVKMEGNTYVTRFTWLIKDESSKVFLRNTSNNLPSGLFDGDGKKVFEQLRFFTDTEGFVGKSLTDDYDILFLNNGSHSGDEYKPHRGGANDIELEPEEFGIRGFIRSLDFSISGNEPATIRASLEFIQGKTPKSYGSNVPSEPRNFKVVAGNHTSSYNNKDTTVTLSYSTPERDGGESIDSYFVYWRESGGSGGDWNTAVPSPATSTLVVKTGLTANTTYDFKVRARSSNGKGKETYIVSHTTDAS